MGPSVFNLLYKYRKFDTRALRILVSKELYFAAPDALNDPLDCRLPVLSFLDQIIAAEPVGNSRNILSRLRDMTVTNRTTGGIELMHRTFETLPLTTGILSLSRDPTDALLWSHYADGHRGFCLGFEPSYFDDLIANWEQHDLLGASDVNYVDMPLLPFRNLWFQKAKDIEAAQTAPVANKEVLISEFSESYKRDVIVTVLTTKSKHWAYEREYRAVREKPGLIAFPAPALREIIFGLRSSDADRLTVKTLLDGPEWEHVRFRRPVWTASSFALELENY